MYRVSVGRLEVSETKGQGRTCDKGDTLHGGRCPGCEFRLGFENVCERFAPETGKVVAAADLWHCVEEVAELIGSIDRSGPVCLQSALF